MWRFKYNRAALTLEPRATLDQPMRTNATYTIHTHRLMRMLTYVASHGGVTPADIADHIGVAAPTVYRFLLEIRAVFGAKIQWDRRNAEYAVTAWGVLDETEVVKFLRRHK